MPTDVASFHHADTGTWTHVVADPVTSAAAVIDPVLDFDPASGRAGTTAARVVLDHLRRSNLKLEWILETHAHADHLSAAAWLQRQAGGPVAIGAGIAQTQRSFKQRLNLGDDFAADGSQFDRLLADGDVIALGSLAIHVLATPGHTPESVSYLIGDAVFIGDTLFGPQMGSARCDFPGGDAATLFHSIQRLYALPADTRMFLCHDYPAQGVEPRSHVSVREQREHNVHVRDGSDVQTFVDMRQQRDAGLATPRLLWPSVQINIRAGQPPPAESSGHVFLKLPFDGRALDEP